MKRHFSFLLILLLALGLSTMGVGTALAETAGADVKATEEMRKPGLVIEPRAELVLKAMSEYMKSVKQFSFRGKISFDEILPSGQKVQYSAENKVAVRRPDRVYADHPWRERRKVGA